MKEGENVGSTTSQFSTAQESAEAGIESLWSEFKRTGEQSLRNQLIIYYSPFVKYIAGRVLAGLPRHFDEEDLVSYGIIGLIDAIERFELDRNLRFETYAIPRIKGAIIDELRSIDWVPRSVRTKARAVEQAFTHLEGTLRRTPNEAEVAAELEMSVGDFHKALRKISTVGMMALDEVLRGGDRSERSTLGETLPDGSWGPVDTFEAKESKEALVDGRRRHAGARAHRPDDVLLRRLDPDGDRPSARRHREQGVPDPHQGAPSAPFEAGRPAGDRPARPGSTRQRPHGAPAPRERAGRARLQLLAS